MTTQTKAAVQVENICIFLMYYYGCLCCFLGVPHCPPKVHFSCANSNCVPLDKHCNEVDDCGDNSDEFNCK